MIIAKLEGGLGNQMFQYATAYATALRVGTNFSLDDSWFFTAREVVDTPRDYELAIFLNLSAPIADGEKCKYLCRNSWTEKIWRHTSKFIPLPKYPLKSYIRETGLHYQKILKNISLLHDVYIAGYWQSELYFKEFETEIKKDFTFPECTNEHNVNLMQKLNNSKDTVSIHVRCGDYINNLATKEYHGGVCTDNYYKKSIEYITKIIKNPDFIVFSDDQKWVKENLTLPETAIYVDWNSGENSFRDMQLMAACSHHIIANSSFSWWGAWLGKNPDKVVCSPNHWFNKENLVKHDIIPEKWIKIDHYE